MIGILDVDLIDRKTRFPNLVCMKISGYYKRLGVALITSLEDALDCDRLFISKVFTESNEPNWLSVLNVPKTRGGTGYGLHNAKQLPCEIEHAFPDYTLYESYAKNSKHITGSARDAYLKASVGFLTRGCFRHCPFCVNRDRSQVVKASPLSEFYDSKRPYIMLLDDNVLGYSKWKSLFEELIDTGKKCSFRQGLDIRLMTPDKAQALQKMSYWNDVFFAFDNIDSKEQFIRGAECYREYCDKETSVYCLVGYYKNGLDEIQDYVERVNICKRFKMFPYIMKHQNGKSDRYSDIFVQAARFHNQKSFCRNGDLIEFILRYGSKKSKRLIETDSSLKKELDKLECKGFK